jgi:carbamoyl-phosphate synthase large subunit
MTRAITVLQTGGGCPGARTVARLLRENSEREVRIVMTDTRPLAHGRWAADAFHLVPPGISPEFIPALRGIVERERVDVVIPQVGEELPALAENADNLGAKVLVSPPDAVRHCRCKAALCQIAGRLAARGENVPASPHWALCYRPRKFVEAAGALGFPERPVCYKPNVGRGGKGFAVLRTPVQLAKALEALGDSLPSVPQIVMEYVEGDELRADLLCREGKVLTGFIKKYHYIRDNIGLEFETVDRPDLMEAAAILVDTLGLDWLVNIQFKGDHLLEINPRISTMIATPEYNMPWLAVKLALGLVDADEVRRATLPPGSKSVRYWDQVFYADT